ncbi:hypothetical protein HMPREF1624_06835 [Sporothrix schenckii ATCC 58251]|uniref:DNA2/NAM7 helicase-like C-terminal domain-containing protein n=1 Tax=Sporothrix schenckii (strain ATCC 58251 / de Perez 2211183) TaxID=1391915 RepID=U7PNW7_SPOS1|nr:hypothetical protein HMPREF1624_06835 [Sporothrix schenckii ATCC 58251]
MAPVDNISVTSLENEPAWGSHDIDDPNNIDQIFSAMEAFLAKNSIGGRLQFELDGHNHNVSQIPQRLLQQDEPPKADIIVRFKSIEHFKTIHKQASEYEDALETKDVDDFNKEGNSFKAWPLVSIPEGDDITTWMILVEPRQIIEARIPNVGESCLLRLVNPNSDEGVSAWWNARRAHNNFAEVSKGKESWSKLIVFNVRLVKSEDESNCVIHALIPSDGKQHENLEKLELTKDNAVSVGLFFTKSDATFEAEMKSLSKLVKASNIPPVTPLATVNRGAESEQVTKVGVWLDLAPELLPETKPIVVKKPINPRAVQAQQVEAFKYLLDFHEPESFVNIFDIYPHMREPNRPGSGIPSAILKKYARMNEHQRNAYNGLLSKMPYGIAMLPGGPGGGKTDWVMTVIGLMQSKSRAKVLYLLDINGPLDDATAKYIWLMQNAGLPKRAIRMKNFGTEFKRSVRVGAMNTRTKGSEEPEVDFSRNFLSLYTQHAAGTAPDPTRTRHQHILPSLDEAAWEHYDKHRDEFETLTDAIATCNGSPLQNRQLRREIYVLYSAVLRLADFIATTPCVAASAFSHMFIPDLVVFDEAAHARELSTLISIANFCPKTGWIFIGDHRQTQPTVKSNNTNPHGRQLATSAMERAYLAGVLNHQLLINHRAFGRLERLPSKLIYGGKMVSGIPHIDRFPRWAKFVRGYLDGLAGLRCSTPRLIVHLNGVGRPTKVGTSWYHQQHMQWTMERVWELINNPRFRSAENEDNKGTILLLAPYKAAVTKYQEAIEALAKAHPNHRIPQRVEARTWDSSQGHEADIVAIDYVREYPTGFMDGMYRFNVGLTRARQGEWHLMHPNMPKAETFQKTNYLRKLYSACEKGLDGLGEGRIANITWGAQPIATVHDVPGKVLVKEETVKDAPIKDEIVKGENTKDDSAGEPSGEELPVQDFDAPVLILSDIEPEEDGNEMPKTPHFGYTHSSAANSQASLRQETTTVVVDGLKLGLGCELPVNYDNIVW